LDTIRQYQERVAKELEKFTKQLESQHPRELYHPITYMLSLGGKRMRPALVLAGCEAFGGNIEKAIHAAFAIEVFHNFTLVHDDIMDKAPLRRNKPTVHKKWDEGIAILSGDAMLVQAYQLVCKTDPEALAPVLDVFSATAIQVCEGQQLDMNYEKAHKISIPQYLHMIHLKTAVLLGASLKIGALIGGARTEDAQRLCEFGNNIGLAFQLQDDILDVYGNEQQFGKQVGGDIISNKKTWLLIKALELTTGNRYMAEELQQWIFAPNFDPAEKVKAVRSIYDFLNVRNLAEAEMQKYYKKSLDCLRDIPVSDEKKQPLISFAESLMVREA
jgi:geranylgeranyl diphosphate synthase, type II